MRTKSLTTIIIFLLLAATGLTFSYYLLERHIQINGKPVFTPPPLRLFTDQIAGILTVSGIIEETNRHRLEHDMPELKENELLNEAATLKALDILEKQYFDHVSPEGKGPADIVDTTAYAYLSVGENLALGNFKDDVDVVQAWMDSPGHRENILSSGFTEIGVAAVKGEFEGREAWVGVQMFGLPESACPTPNAQIRSNFDQGKKSIETREVELNRLKDNIDTLSASLQAMQSEINDLIKRGQDKIRAGNEDIRRGNEIYEETGDREKAQPYWDSGAAKQKEGDALLQQAKQKQPAADAKRSELRAKQSAYNEEVRRFQNQVSDFKKTSEALNNQIRTYNNCLEKYN